MKKTIQRFKNQLYLIQVWLRRMYAYPSIDLQGVDYDSYWKDKRGENIGSLSSWQKERADFVLETLNKNQQETTSFIDIGCGDGSILHYIKSKRNKQDDIFGVDISSFALERAEKLGVSTTKADITKITSDDIQPVDYGILFEILEHVPDSERMLDVVYKKMNKAVFFSFPNTGFVVHRLRLLFGKFPLQWRLAPGEHLRYWTARDLRWWLKSLGYTKYTIHYYQGVPVLNKVFPSLFAAGFVVYLQK